MNKIKELYKNYGYYINYILLVALNGFTSILNYISSIYINRSLSISDFAYYNGIINIYSIIILTVSSFSYYIMHNYENEEDAKRYWANGYFIAIIIFVVFVFSIPLIDILFNIKNYKAMFLISIAIFISVFTIVSQSILKINNYIGYDYMASFIATLFGKIILLAIFIITGLSLEKSIICVLISCLIYFIIHIFELKKKNLPYYAEIKNLKKYFSVKDLSDFKNYIINVVIINFIFNWISLNDVLMANRYLDKLSAGYYSTIALIIKMFFYIGAPIAAVMFSYILISMKNKNKDKERKVLYYSIILYLFFSFTERYEAIIPLIPKAVLFGFSLGFAVLTFNYGLAYKLFYPFYGYLIIFAYVYFSLRNGERTFERFIFIMTVFYLILFIYNLLIIIFHRIFLLKNKIY